MLVQLVRDGLELDDEFAEAVAGSNNTGGRKLHIGKGGKPGHPIYVDDDWAYEQITAGRDEREVFRGWQDRPGVLARPSQDWEVFKAAMRRRRARAMKTTK